MDEQDVVRQAHSFLNGLDLSNIRDDLGPYLAKVAGRVRKEKLLPRESGTVTEIKGKTVITVNENESDERQRFTICHELGHKILGLPSSHQHVPQWGYAKRDSNEVFCDIFAAELLMPHEQFKQTARHLEPSLRTIETLMDAFKTSFPATASRFARLADTPCVFVTMESGWVKYAAFSTPLRAMGAKITFKSPIPTESIAAQLRASGSSDYREGYVAQDVWLENWQSGLELNELSRHHASSDTTLSLLWFDPEDAPTIEVDRYGRVVAEDDGLQELTGELPWPGRSKRKR